MASKPTISLCMIARDEEKFIKKCLKSVKPLVDEIIIVDTGSKDNTIETAKSFGAKVIEHKWDDNFSRARNIGLKYATKDWILVLDADETISNRDLKKIKELLEQDKYDAFYLIQRNYFREGVLTVTDVSSRLDDYPESKGYIGWSPGEITRLFRNHKGYFFNGIIHESVNDSIRDKGGKIKNTAIPIHHFRGEKDVGFKLKKTQKYHDMCKKQIALTPNDPKPHKELGLMYKAEKAYDKAIIQFEKAMKLIEGSKTFDDRLMYTSVLLNLGEAYIRNQRYEDAILYLNKVLRMFPESPVVYSLLGKAYHMLDKVQEAIEFYQKAAKLKPDAEGVHHNLVDLYLKTGQFENAINQLKIAVRYSPNSAIIYRNFGVVYLRMGKYASSYDCFKKSIELNPKLEKDLKEILTKLEKVKDNEVDTEYSFSAKDME